MIENDRHENVFFSFAFYYLLIKNNRFGYDYKGAAVKIMDLAKTTKTLVRVNESYIYNPAPIGQKRIELRMDTSNRLSFESSASWWGSSDTSNLFSFAAPSSFKLNDWAIAHWYASPFGKYPLKVTNVRALIRNSKGYAFPDYSFRPMEGLFFALGGGSFSPTTSFISSSNVVASDFTLPDTGDYAVMAVIDADTFRPDNSKLKIVETSSSRISIAPNPTQDQLNIEGLKQPVVLQLLDMNSRILWQNNVYQNTFSLSLKAYSAGVYLLRIVEKEGSSTLFKILKE